MILRMFGGYQNVSYYVENIINDISKLHLKLFLAD